MKKSENLQSDQFHYPFDKDTLWELPNFLRCKFTVASWLVFMDISTVLTKNLDTTFL